MNPKKNITPGMLVRLITGRHDVKNMVLFVVEAHPFVCIDAAPHSPDVEIVVVRPDGTAIGGNACSCCIEVLND